jgi:TIR domain
MEQSGSPLDPHGSGSIERGSEDAAESPIARAPRLFISYRRQDTREFVTTLDARLRADLGARNVFRDVQDLIAGEIFTERIVAEILESDVVLIVIGPMWEGAGADPSRPSRLADPADFVRREVGLALQNRPRSTPIPILVDGAHFPQSLPAELDPVREHQAVELGNDELKRSDSGGYQRVLVGVWLAKSRSVPNGVIIFGDDSPTAKAQLDQLVEEMKRARLVDVSAVSRYACGAQVLSRRKARRVRRRFPSVIILVDEDSADSPVLAGRVEALADHGVRNIALVTLGGATIYGAGVATSTGDGGATIDRLRRALDELGKPKPVTKASRLWSWRRTLSPATKLAVGAAAAGALTGGGLLVHELLEDADPPILEGDWDVGTFAVEQEGIAEDSPSRPFPGGLISIRRVDPGCTGEGCALTVTAGPQVLRGATLEPASEENRYSTVLANDEEETIRLINGGGFRCRGTGDGTDVTDQAELSFETRKTDSDAGHLQVEFAIVVDIPATTNPTGNCQAATVTWTATAEKRGQG